MSALGVSAGAPDAKGVVGDLGGASLELIEISPKGLGRGETFPLGPLTLARDDEFDYERVSEQVDEVLATHASCSASAAAISTPLAALGARSGASTSRCATTRSACCIITK